VQFPGLSCLISYPAQREPGFHVQQSRHGEFIPRSGREYTRGRPKITSPSRSHTILASRPAALLVDPSRRHGFLHEARGCPRMPMAQVALLLCTCVVSRTSRPDRDHRTRGRPRSRRTRKLLHAVWCRRTPAHDHPGRMHLHLFAGHHLPAAPNSGPGVAVHDGFIAYRGGCMGPMV
jgi:hypothetical protein